MPVRTAASLSAEADQWKQRSAAAQPATARGNLRRPVAVCFRYSRPDFPHGLAVSAPARVRLTIPLSGRPEPSDSPAGVAQRRGCCCAGQADR